MSRFLAEYHQKLLNARVPGRWRAMKALRKEKQLWKCKKGLYEILFLTVFFLLAGTAFLAAFIGLIISFFSEFYLEVCGIVFLGSALALIMLPFAYVIYVRVRQNRNIKNRKEVKLDDFISGANVLQKYNKFHVKAGREVVGVVYGVKPAIVYKTDTPQSLKKLCLSTPYGFEVVLGVAKKSGIVLEDAEVDRIAGRIYDNARNVEELVSILCEEMAAAEESQESKDFEAQLLAADVTDTACVSKARKRYLGLPGFVALLCFVGAMSGALENKENFFNKSNLIMVLSFTLVGYVIGLVIKILGTRWLNSLDKKNNEEPIDIEMIKDYFDKSSPGYYVQQCLTDMCKTMDTRRTLRKCEELPCFPEIESGQRPWFAEFANRLKLMTGVQEIPYTSPKHGTVELLWTPKDENEKPQKIRLHVEFLDGIKDGYITLRIEPLIE